MGTLCSKVALMAPATCVGWNVGSAPGAVPIFKPPTAMEFTIASCSRPHLCRCGDGGCTNGNSHRGHPRSAGIVDGCGDAVVGMAHHNSDCALLHSDR